MKRANIRPGDRVAPRQQQNWDWRAAANFICGGAGGGLLFLAALAAMVGAPAAPMLLLGMALIGTGLICVWFEIGRPLRALNVYRHLASSWMTREAAFAPLVFACGAAAVITGQVLFAALAGLFGAGFLYSQARILAADKGIPAWRHPRCLPLVLATGFVEGAGLLAIATPWLAPLSPVHVAWVLIALLALRVMLWRGYVGALRSDGAPDGTLRALAESEGRFVTFGNAVPGILAVLATFGTGATAIALIVAGALAAGGGVFLKYVLIRRAAFTQGMALKHLPVRGRGTAGPAVKPGWGGTG